MIELKNIIFSYKDHRVLDDVSATFEPGRFYGIFGPNGCGKSTLLKIITGELTPDSGTVLPFFSGVLERARKIAFVEQDVPVRIPLSVRAVTALGRYPWRRGPEKPEVVERVLGMLRLLPFAEKPYNCLSGGERQRVMLARALAQETPILILDEPASSLDIGFQHSFYKTLRELSDQGKCILMVSHDLFTAPRYLGCALLLNGGKIHGAGAPEQTLSPEHLNRVFDVRI